MEAHTMLQIICINGELDEIILPPNAIVEHLKGHLMCVTAIDGARITYNFRHVVHYKLTERPATPAEGS
jgi:hypothetical protein